ncbi:hypothetical protein Bpfe_031128 [Biomphalaria pfeifferi]|uniref:Uncharacterized protein n=1 Tax=Biomphalaria pfeifferi TaxID=112525 RepID=A0AAD8AND8_BIOPF|nr:hypothetical protein Bpfe_031128 [Biomphalaria pfeifferi]
MAIPPDLELPAMTALVSHLNESKPFNVAFRRTGKLVADDMNSIVVIMWNQGVDAAFEYFTKNVLNGPTEMSVCWNVESMAFPGTNFELLFNRMCGEA